MSHPDAGGAVEFASLHHADMGIQVELPTGWELQADEDGNVLVCIADEQWEDDGYAPSITIQREAPLADEDAELDQLAAASLEQLQSSYAGFELAWSRRDGDRIVRAYEFDPQDLDRRVRQVQGIVADVGTYVVTGTAPLALAEVLTSVFEHVIASVRSAAP